MGDCLRIESVKFMCGELNDYARVRIKIENTRARARARA